MKCFLTTLKTELLDINSATAKFLQSISLIIKKSPATKASSPYVVSRTVLPPPKMKETANNIKVKPPQTVLTIKQRGDFPLKGFPRTLKTLSINGIGSCQMHRGILMLSNLTTLSLSDNCLQKLPEEMGNLKLDSLDLSKNDFGASKKLSDWNWLEGGNLKQSLTVLNLSSNKLKFIPPQLMDCENLSKLLIDSNCITKIPFSFKNLTKLRVLNLSSNQIDSFPSTFISGRFLIENLDISNNAADTTTIAQIKENFANLVRAQSLSQVQTLLELAAQSITTNKIPYRRHLIPPILKEILQKSPTCIQCDKISLSRPIVEKIFFTSSSNLPARHITSTQLDNVILDGSFCSHSCIQRLQRRIFGKQSLMPS